MFLTVPLAFETFALAVAMQELPTGVSVRFFRHHHPPHTTSSPKQGTAHKLAVLQ